MNSITHGNNTLQRMILSTVLGTVLLGVCPLSIAQSSGQYLAQSTGQSSTKQDGWFIRPAIGLATLSDQSGTANDVLGQNGNVDVALDNGFNAGIGAGYYFDDNWAVELYWEYRSNDAITTLPDGTSFTQGNYASSIVATNVYYFFDSDSRWQWYTGAGLAFTQEIDIDLEDDSLERSFSGSGDVGFQLMVGADYAITEQLSVQSEIRLLRITDVTMDAEENVISGQFTNIDYTPTTWQISLVYRF